MALGDFDVVKTNNNNTPSATTYTVKSGAAATIKAGDSVTVDGSNAGYVLLGVDGGSNALTWVGFAASTSTDTATADGTVEVYDDTNYTYRGKYTSDSAPTRATMHTQVTLDVTSAVQTIDVNDTTNGTFILVDFDTTLGTVDFKMATNDHITAG